MYKAIFWDWDGTLVDTFPVITEAINAARLAANLAEWSQAQVQDEIGKKGRVDFVEMFGVEQAQDAEDTYYKTITKISADKVVLKENRKEFLEKLSSQNIPMAVVSNKRGDLLRKEIEALGLDKYFITAIGAGDLSADKPQAEPFKKAACIADVDIAEVCYIGDAPVDQQATINAGMKSVVLLAGETHTKEQLDEILTYGRVATFDELPYLLNIEH